MDDFAKLLFHFYASQLNKNPIRTKAISSATIAFSGDLLSQKLQALPIWDRHRSLKFFVYGTLIGTIIHFWYKFLDFVFKACTKQDKKKNTKFVLLYWSHYATKQLFINKRTKPEQTWLAGYFSINSCLHHFRQPCFIHSWLQQMENMRKSSPKYDP